jgi:hypothetical protein
MTYIPKEVITTQKIKREKELPEVLADKELLSGLLHWPLPLPGSIQVNIVIVFHHFFY